MTTFECELIEDRRGMWFIQFERQGKSECHLLDAEDEEAAQYEAMEHGFNLIRVCRRKKPVTEVKTPKGPSYP